MILTNVSVLCIQKVVSSVGRVVIIAVLNSMINSLKNAFSGE